MNRPRRHDRRHWPDYLNARPKASGLYYFWKHPKTGKEYGLGYHFPTAAAESREANLKMMAENVTRATLSDRIDGTAEATMSAWLDIYAANIAKRKSGKKGGKERAEATKRVDARMIQVMRDHFKDSLITKVTTKDCSALLHKYRDAGHDRAAVNVRSYLVDCFNEAESEGWIPRGTNPAEIIKINAPETKRGRLSIDQFNMLLSNASGWVRTSLLLALITGQRVSDVSVMEYASVKAGFLYVQQIKTGERIMIPIALELIGYSLESIIKQSRKIVGAKTIVHQTESTGRSSPGDALREESISRAFTALAREHLKGYEEGEYPTFHEIRALSKKLHTERGIDTLALLGHESEQTGKTYADPRGGWVEVKIPRTA